MDRTPQEKSKSKQMISSVEGYGGDRTKGNSETQKDDLVQQKKAADGGPGVEAAVN